jgi:hypothetical protein
MVRAVMLLALVVVTACSTFANSSAPGKDPTTVYVAGQKAPFFGVPHGQVWLCPSTPGKGDCKEIEVAEVTK